MRIYLPMLVLLASNFGCRTLLAQEHADRGAVVGGLAGALIGAAIGDQNGETTEGALIGGAVGLLSGTAIGSSVDAEQARTRAWYNQQRLAQVSRAVSMADVVTMSQNGVSDPVITDRVRQYGVQRRLEVADVIMLHKQGVSESVITAMQQAPVAAQTATHMPPTQATPVIVERRHFVAPGYYVYPPPPRYHYHGWPHRYVHPHRSRVHFGFSIHQ